MYINAEARKSPETIFERSGGYDTRKVLNRAPGTAGLVRVESPALGKRYILPGLFGWEGKPGFAVVEYGKAFGRIIRKGKVFPTAQAAIENMGTDLGKGKEKKLRPCYRVA